MSFSSGLYVKMFTDMMSEGFIVIDKEGKIQVYNNKAKEIFGLRSDYRVSHDKGRINHGDIVIIANNSIGQDDGKMDSESLRLIGVNDPNIQVGDSIVAIGIFNEENIIKSEFKVLKKGHDEKLLKLKSNFLEIDIEAIIDFPNKTMSIRVEDEEFTMDYINAIGHLVVLDKSTKDMKFYQSQGYTARVESINDLLRGEFYRAKGEDVQTLDVIGNNILETHKSDSIIKHFYQVAKGDDFSYLDEFEEINGYPTISTLLPVEENGKRVGAVLKVEDISEIRRVIDERDKAIQELEKAGELLLEEEALKKAFPSFVGNSQQIEYVKKMALKTSRTNSNVLILGESGTGKTLLAKSIHENSKIRDKPFVHVNCGAIPDNLLESELFGYERGAFTGARNEGKKGFFEMANGGTIFLDEIGDISQNLQVKLLQVIQEKNFYRVGGTETIKVDIRIIAATNKNLEEEMLKGSFREDLYYRINVFPIWIPPLRERKEDINPLIKLLLPKICEEIGFQNKRISAEAVNKLLKYNWPGNTRELENILERAVNLAEGNNILSKHVNLKIDKTETLGDGIMPLKDFLEEEEKKAIENTLLFYNGDRKMAIKALAISKTTFYEKMKKYNIK